MESNELRDLKLSDYCRKEGATRWEIVEWINPRYLTLPYFTSNSLVWPWQPPKAP